MCSPLFNLAPDTARSQARSAGQAICDQYVTYIRSFTLQKKLDKKYYTIFLGYKDISLLPFNGFQGNSYNFKQ